MEMNLKCQIETKNGETKRESIAEPFPTVNPLRGLAKLLYCLIIARIFVHLIQQAGVEGSVLAPKYSQSLTLSQTEFLESELGENGSGEIPREKIDSRKICRCSKRVRKRRVRHRHWRRITKKGEK